MATLAPPQGKTRTVAGVQVPVIFWPLLGLTLLGEGLAIYRLVVGLGPTTNLSDHYPWGLWITIDLFLIPFAGAAFTISLISYFLGREDYHSIIRPAVLAGLIGYGIVGILLFLDIGRWNQFYNIFVFPWINLHSFLEEISLCVTLYTAILMLEIAPVFLEKRGYTKAIRWIEGSILLIAGAGIVLSMLHQSSLGSLFLLMPYKLHPLWWTPALPPLLLMSLFSLLAFALPSHGKSPAKPAGRPNILFVIMDDVGIDQVAHVFDFEVENEPATPNIEQIAAAGVRFGNAWAMPACSTSRAAIS